MLETLYNMNNMDNFSPKDFESYLQKQVEILQEQFRGRAPGRADPSLISNIIVQLDGYKASIRELCSISQSADNSLSLNLKVFDKNNVKNIESALWKSELGSVVTTGQTIIFTLPPLTRDYLMRVLKTLKESVEQQKVIMRNYRRTTLDKISSLKKTQLDLYKSHENTIQKILDQYILQADNLYKSLEKKLNS